MNRRVPGDDPTRLIDEINSQQRNLQWYDILRNSRGIDDFFWWGSPHPTRVQRTAAWLCGLMEIGLGVEFLGLAIRDRHQTRLDRLTVAMATLILLYVGIRTFRNGFPRVPRDRQK